MHLYVRMWLFFYLSLYPTENTFSVLTLDTRLLSIIIDSCVIRSVTQTLYGDRDFVPIYSFKSYLS